MAKCRKTNQPLTGSTPQQRMTTREMNLRPYGAISPVGAEITELSEPLLKKCDDVRAKLTKGNPGDDGLGAHLNEDPNTPNTCLLYTSDAADE